jgi:hypothetical protein
MAKIEIGVSFSNRHSLQQQTAILQFIDNRTTVALLYKPVSVDRS